ncbi:hypothetical protein mRhiFer1_009408 [Rhinolophus ferrumequinum]|uniref:Uncharacterized protein n=1 Tax=Rhinolophus ferrumequinum TaxID=59479 RepID=A0A7J7RQE7_RHIFE|nr:hypothetical protein mRhiFer1_009408 [Rhinolophus ferrumequinum]
MGFRQCIWERTVVNSLLPYQVGGGCKLWCLTAPLMPEISHNPGWHLWFSSHLYLVSFSRLLFRSSSIHTQGLPGVIVLDVVIYFSVFVGEDKFNILLGHCLLHLHQSKLKKDEQNQKHQTS